MMLAERQDRAFEHSRERFIRSLSLSAVNFRRPQPVRDTQSQPQLDDWEPESHESDPQGHRAEDWKTEKHRNAPPAVIKQVVARDERP